MALIKCEDCNKEYSNKIDACIHCGCPNEINKPEIQQKINEECPIPIKGNEVDIYYNPESFNVESHPLKKLFFWITHLTFIYLIFTLTHDSSGGTVLLLFGWVITLGIISAIEDTLPHYKKQEKKLLEKKKNIESIREYFEKRFPIYNNMKSEFNTLEVIHQNSKTREESMFNIYMKAYRNNADAIVLNSDTIQTNVSGTISTGYRTNNTSGHISSDNTNSIMATLVKY